MSIVINKQQYNVPELVTMSWLDGISWIKYITDKNTRTRQIRSIVAHTHEGVVSNLLSGAGPNSKIDEALARYQVNTERQVSWDYTVDSNGDVICQNDPLVDYSWQAGKFNPSSLGFELVQHNKDSARFLYETQIEKAVLLIDFLTAALGIQRQIPWNKKDNKPCLTQIQRIIDNNNFIGILGHVNLTNQRSKHDPGSFIFEALKNAGYECFDIETNEDLETWKQRQKTVCGFEDKDADGIPLKNTVTALKAKGYKHGMFVARPIDALISVG